MVQYLWNSVQKSTPRAEQAERENAKAQKAAQEALDKALKAEAEKQAALEKAKHAEKATKLQIAKQLLQANMDIAFIRQVTGLKKMEITQLKE